MLFAGWLQAAVSQVCQVEQTELPAWSIGATRGHHLRVYKFESSAFHQKWAVWLAIYGMWLAAAQPLGCSCSDAHPKVLDA